MRQDENRLKRPVLIGKTMFFTVLQFERKVHFAGAGRLYDQAADYLAGIGLLSNPGHLLVETERFLMEGPLCETLCIDKEAGELGKYKGFSLVAGWLEVTFIENVRGLKWRELLEFKKLAAEREEITKYLHACALYDLQSVK